jgi:hypothetical protein
VSDCLKRKTCHLSVCTTTLREGCQSCILVNSMPPWQLKYGVLLMRNHVRSRVESKQSALRVTISHPSWANIARIATSHRLNSNAHRYINTPWHTQYSWPLDSLTWPVTFSLFEHLHYELPRWLKPGSKPMPGRVSSKLSGASKTDD